MGRKKKKIYLALVLGYWNFPQTRLFIPRFINPDTLKCQAKTFSNSFHIDDEQVTHEFFWSKPSRKKKKNPQMKKSCEDVSVWSNDDW